MPETKETALTLPESSVLKKDIVAINQFQKIVKETLIAGHDYGIIPGTINKPTLLKPGAEKIAKLLGLSDSYEIIDCKEDWDKPFFRYLIKCKLASVATGVLISEGLGECNSYESKYRWRWVFGSEIPDSIKPKLVKEKRRAKSGKEYIMYRMENEDIFSQVNTILKMAKKRALVDASLSAGRLSDVFTQDIEDMAPEKEEAKDIDITISELYPEQGNPEAPAAKTSLQILEQNRDVYLKLVAGKKKFDSPDTAQKYLFAKYSIDAKRLIDDLDNVKKEVAEKEGW